MHRIILAIPAYFAPYIISDEPDFACWVTAILALLLGGTVGAVLAAVGVIGFFRFLRLKRIGQKEIKERAEEAKERLITTVRSFINKEGK